MGVNSPRKLMAIQQVVDVDREQHRIAAISRHGRELQGEKKTGGVVRLTELVICNLSLWFRVRPMCHSEQYAAQVHM